MSYYSDSDELMARVRMLNRASRIDTYRKATANMSSDERGRYNDGQIMDYFHNAMHQIEDHAGNHLKHQRTIDDHNRSIQEVSNKQRGIQENIKSILSMLLKNFSGAKINNASLSPHVFHIAEKHGVMPGILRRLLSGKIDLDQATKMAVNDIMFHKHHDPEDLSSSMFNKSLCEAYKKGIDNIINVGLSGNALSMYRPSPPLFVDQFQKPDAEFIKLLIKNNKYNDAIKDRVVEPNEAKANQELMDKIGIPEVKEETPQMDPRQLLQQVANRGK